MSVKYVYLRHCVDNFMPVVRLLSKRVTEQIELGQEGEVLQEV
jgi:hypothetical protein